MKCNNCGFENEEAFEYCPSCGTVSSTDFAGKVRLAVSGSKFFAICILITVVAAFTLFNGSLDILSVLLSIFLWLSYNSAKKGENFGSNLRCVSGTVYANYIIVNVVAIISMICGVITAAFSGVLAHSAEDIKNLVLSSLDVESTVGLVVPEFTSEIAGVILVVLGVMFILVGIIVMVINVLSLKRIHIFVKSVYTGVLSGNAAVTKAASAKTWITVFGVLSAISAVFYILVAPLSAIVSGCSAAAAFLASSLIGENFAE